MPDFQITSEPTQGLRDTRVDPGSSSVAELRQVMAAGRLTASALTEHYLDRIKELNSALHAVITVNPDAAAEAAASDEAWESGRPRGPLEGIPVLVKDNVQVGGMPTTAGSPALLPACPPDAFIVSRLRAAGAVILAKANLSEWANFRSTHSSSGWSTLGGQAANPYAFDRSPSGSSSGSAAGVAAGLAPLAVGTETDGSIVSPSSACGVVGIKPTAGLVSRTGIVPLSPVQDTAGPMARSVADAAAMLSVLAAADPDDPAVSDCPERTSAVTDYTQFLDPAGLEGARIGVWRAASARAAADTRALLDAAVQQLRALGATVTDPVDLPDVEKITIPEFDALYYEFKYGINAYLKYLAAQGGGEPGVPSSLAELIEFNERNADWVLSRFGQEIFQAAEATSGDLTDPDYLELRGAATRLAAGSLEAPTAEHKLDAIISLTANPAWLTDYVLGDHSVFGASRPAAVSGWPAISVPFGYVSGLPVGVSIVGPRWSEPRLIAIAYAFEQATMPRRRLPSLLPSLGQPAPTRPPSPSFRPPASTQRHDNLAIMDAWRAAEVPVLPGRGPQARLRDTATGELSVAAAGRNASLYACGITPYDATHLGHAATFTAWDLLVRAWLDAGYDVTYTQNVTDVDDPLLERAERDGEDWRELARRETDRYRRDMEALRVLPPAHLIGAVEAVPLIDRFAERLAARGALYDLEGDTYFARCADSSFGALSGPGSATGLSVQQMTALSAERGGDPDRPGKKDPLDALVWRAERPGEPAWDSHFGAGRPGWHVECAAIAVDYLGTTFDVQAGGSDLVFPHHEMSASHARVACGEHAFARVYAHSGMVAYQGAKMSKSLGNLVFVSKLRESGADPMAIRLALVTHHYRSDWEWTDAALTEATHRLTRWRTATTPAPPTPAPPTTPPDPSSPTAPTPPPAASPATASGPVPGVPSAEAVLRTVRERLAEDLDAPGAIAAIDAWADATLAAPPGSVSPAEARLIRDTADALLGIVL